MNTRLQEIKEAIQNDRITAQTLKDLKRLRGEIPRGETLLQEWAYTWEIPKKLEQLRQGLENEEISYEELFELQNLVKFIDPEDDQLLEAAAVKEFDDDDKDEEEVGEKWLYMDWDELQIKEIATDMAGEKAFELIISTSKPTVEIAEALIALGGNEGWSVSQKDSWKGVMKHCIKLLDLEKGPEILEALK